MRRTAAILALLATTSNALAITGPLDGVYNCQINPGRDTVSTFLTINGRPDGFSIWAVPALSANNDLYGYGLGQATTTAFSGFTMFGHPFHVTAGEGKINGFITMEWGGQIVNAAVACSIFF